MKNWMKVGCVMLAMVVAFGSGMVLVSAQAAPKSVKGVIVGEVVDVASYAMKGFIGAEHADVFANRAELGFPVAIVEDETKEVYICVFRTPAPASPLDLANDVLAPYMGKKVAAQGLLYKAEGVNVIRLSVISEY